VRIGQGFDVHAFAPGRRLVIGGVAIPHEKGLEGHSDADVLLHAICDALLGAAALGDIGKHFPDSDPAYAGADSRRLLRTFVNRGLLAVVGATFVFASTALLVAPDAGPTVASSTGLFELFGYGGLFAGTVLLLRVVAAVARDGTT